MKPAEQPPTIHEPVRPAEVGGADDILPWNATAAVTGADEQPAAITLRFVHALDEFMNAAWFEDFVIISFHIRLVVHFDEDVFPTSREQPLACFIGSTNDGCFVFETLVLTKVKVAEDDDHAVGIGGVEHGLYTTCELGAKATLFIEGNADPGLCF